ncbi:hypothetical protein BROUX41_005898 [Berkeleyomyces rouxiae]|uniref:uncharacterized protein n=1 Tax=Berkeleyomyces rouxiae TaxID=2035830 RepID=UPI003B79F8B6
MSFFSRSLYPSYFAKKPYHNTAIVSDDSSNSSTSPSDNIWCHDTLVPQNRDCLRVLSKKEYKRVGWTLSLAFARDPLTHYLVACPDLKNCSEESLWNLHKYMLTCIASYYLLIGKTFCIGPDYNSIALWVLPGTTHDERWSILRSGLWRLQYKLSSEGRRRYYTEVVPKLDRLKQKIMGKRDGDCYYLVYLATKPSCQGKGYGSKLIQHMIQQADDEGKPMYLESSSPSNTKYYQKFGFVPKENIRFGPDASILLTAMVREPKVRVSSTSGLSSLELKNTNEST